MRHFYVGPRPLTKERVRAWLLRLMEEGKLEHTGDWKLEVAHYKTGEPLPFVEDGKVEPEDQPTEAF